MHIEQEPEHRGDAVDIAYGGLSLMARGSIVVLVVLICTNSALILLTYGWTNVKINEVVDPQNKVLADILETMHKHRGEQGSEYRALDGSIIRNRDYLRETARVCMYTEPQKLKYQSRLTPAMLDLLFGEKDR